MTVYNALLIDISFQFNAFRCTFCKDRDKFTIPIHPKDLTEFKVGEYYDVDFDISPDYWNNKLSFNVINPAKDTSHD